MPAKVAVTVAALMLVVSTNALEPTTAELVRVRVGTAFELGTAPTVAMDDSVVALVPRVNTLEGDVLVMVMFCPLAGALAVNVPVAVAAAGALPVTAVPLMVTVELPDALKAGVIVPVALATVPPIWTFQSFLIGFFHFIGGIGATGPGLTGFGRTGVGPSPDPIAQPASPATPPLRLICCMVKRGLLTTLSQCS